LAGNNHVAGFRDSQHTAFDTSAKDFAAPWTGFRVIKRIHSTDDCQHYTIHKHRLV
jgi:hypothetical protein